MESYFATLARLKGTATPTVTGGKETNPLWKSNVSNADFAEALKQSLSANTILASDAARFKLSASLIELKQPFIGASMTVTSKVKYVLTDATDNSVIWAKEITTPYTAKFSDAFVGYKRLQLANEGAIRENIKQLVDDLVTEAKANPKLQPVVKPVSTLLPLNSAG
jgi:phage gp29-like protein